MTTQSEMKDRHSKTWSGKTLREELLGQGITDDRICFVEEEIGLSLSRFYYVGTATNLTTREESGVYVEVDDDPDTKPRYYIGLVDIKARRSYLYEEIRARLN